MPTVTGVESPVETLDARDFDLDLQIDVSAPETVLEAKTITVGCPSWMVC